VEVNWSITWQAVLSKSQRKHGWRRSRAQGGRWFSVSVRVSMDRSRVEHEMVGRSSVRICRRGRVSGGVVEQEVAGGPQ
jgi:hypothetical protein